MVWLRGGREDAVSISEDGRSGCKRERLVDGGAPLLTLKVSHAAPPFERRPECGWRGSVETSLPRRRRCSEWEGLHQSNVVLQPPRHGRLNLAFGLGGVLRGIHPELKRLLLSR